MIERKIHMSKAVKFYSRTNEYQLTENVFGRTEKKPVVNRRHGQPPLQDLTSPAEISVEEEEKEEIDETFYGDEGFEAEELDMEGYEIDE